MKNMTDFHAAVISGTHSSVGKTTWALALMSFFRRKELTVQPFKVGPDYIDPGFHHLACRPRKSRNLDRFFLSEEYLKECFWKNSQGTDLAVVEGVMGLFDGRGALSEEGSTAEMAKLLGLPVFLVVDGSGLARSAAAVVKGFQTFDRGLKLSGIFLNQIGGEGHFTWLREAIEKETGIPVLGWLPRNESVSIPQRHLGLRTALEEGEIEEKLNRLGALLEGRFDETRFLRLTERIPLTPHPLSVKTGRGKAVGQCRIGIAYDRAFSFYYEDNFDLLREAGAELVFFSPLADSELPEELDLLYFGGGFPEIYAAELSQNESLKDAIRNFYREGKMIYAECGGLIYLAQAFIDSGARESSLVGLLPGKIRMTPKLQNFGYHEIETSLATFLFPKGRKLRSHEFHYSIWDSSSLPKNSPYRVGERYDGFYDGRLLASYQHLHFGQHPELAEHFVQGSLASRRAYATRSENI